MGFVDRRTRGRTGMAGEEGDESVARKLSTATSILARTYREKQSMSIRSEAGADEGSWGMSGVTYDRPRGARARRLSRGGGPHRRARLRVRPPPPAPSAPHRTSFLGGTKWQSALRGSLCCDGLGWALVKHLRPLWHLWPDSNHVLHVVVWANPI